MKKDLEKRSVEYMGFKSPNTSDEVVLEILGLEMAIKIAEQRIALLKQSIKIAEVEARERLENPPTEG